MGATEIKESGATTREIDTDRSALASLSNESDLLHAKEDAMVQKDAELVKRFKLQKDAVNKQKTHVQTKAVKRLVSGIDSLLSSAKARDHPVGTTMAYRTADGGWRSSKHPHPRP